MFENSSPPPTPRQHGNGNLSKSLLKGLQRPHAKHLLPKRGGWHATKAGADWVQPGFELVCKELKGGELIHAVECMGFHSAKPWTSSDTMKMDDLAARSFTFNYLNRRKGGYRPKTHKRIVKSLHGGKLRFAAGYYDFVWDCLEAIRVGAVSVFLSSIEAGELYEVSSRTFERWVVAAEEAGLIRVLNTQAKNNRVRRNRHRRQGKNCYFAGPALAQAYGPAIYEGLDKEVIGNKLAAAARAQGAKLRKLCREDAHARKNLAWVEKFKTPPTSTLSSDSLSDPPSPDGSEIGASRSEVEERPGAASIPAAPDRGGKLHTRSRGAASLETNPNSTGQKKPSPESTTSNLASSEGVDVGSAGGMSMLEEALARMQAESKRFRGGLHFLVFFLALASTACGTVFDGQRTTIAESGDRAGARTHGIASTPRGARVDDTDARPARVGEGRGPAGGRQGRHSDHDHENAGTGRLAANNWPVLRPDRTKMEQTKVTEPTDGIDIGPPHDTTQGTIDTSDPGRMILESDCESGDMIFSWDIDRPVVVTSRTLEGMADDVPQDAQIVAYARLDDPKYREIMLENLGTTKLPGRLAPGTHSIRVVSKGASHMLVCLTSRTLARSDREFPPEQPPPRRLIPGDALVREADMLQEVLSDSSVEFDTAERRAEEAERRAEEAEKKLSNLELGPYGVDDVAEVVAAYDVTQDVGPDGPRPATDRMARAIEALRRRKT